jgi:hypothetical protein
MRSEHEGFRETFNIMRDKIDRVEKEAVLYNDKFIEYQKHFDEQKVTYEEGIQRVIGKFGDI